MHDGAVKPSRYCGKSGLCACDGMHLEVAADAVQGIPLLAQRGIDGSPIAGAYADTRARRDGGG